MKAITFTLALTVVAPLAAAGQTAPQAAAAPAVPVLPAAIPVGSRVGELPTAYDDGGRRDPFGSLVAPRRTASPSTGMAGRPRAGLASLALADVEVRGIVRSGQNMLAILEGPNKQSFVTRVKDRLVDAVVLSIDTDGVVFSEQLEGSRASSQVRKSLRPAGEGIR